MKYAPRNLARWTDPNRDLGAAWPQYFSSGVGQTRRSHVVERSNFASMLDALGGETKTVKIVNRETILGFGCDLIAIHENDAKALQIADEINAALADSCIIDLEHLEKVEQEEADLTWKICFEPTGRIAYIRKFRSQFQFHNLADLIGCVRGKYFSGYASELLS